MKHLQTILNLDKVSDDKLFSVAMRKSKDPEVIKWVQNVLNTIDCSQKIKITGEFDWDTKLLLTFFQKEYGYKLGKRIPISSKLDKPTWELLKTYLTE